MTIFRGERRTGKTTRLVDLFLRDPNGVLVVPNNSIRDYVQRMFPKVKGREILTPHRLDHELRGLSPEPSLYVDELVLVDRVERISRYAYSRLVAYSASTN